MDKDMDKDMNKDTKKNSDIIFTLRLEKEYLHKDLEKIRKNRGVLIDDRGEEKPGVIQLSWKTNEGAGEAEHKIDVVVKGPNLWVNGYQCQGKGCVGFQAEEGSLNYCESDENAGCILELTAIRSELEKLENIEDSMYFHKGAAGRTPYLMCVFTVSEMVRNEILERLLFCEKGRKHSGIHYNWKDCLSLYKNWKSVSKVLYAVESGRFYPVIYFRDMDSMFVRIVRNRDLYNSVGKKYEDILKDIKAM